MIAKHKGEVPFLTYLLPFITGIVYCLFFNLHKSILPSVCLVTILVLFISLNFTYLRFKMYRFTWLGGLLIHLLFFFGGIIIMQVRDYRNNADYFATQPAQQLLVRINTEPILKGKYWHFVTDVTGTKTSKTITTSTGKLMLTILADSNHTFKYGDELLLRADTKPVDPPYNPSAFNYQNYLANQHIYRQCFLFPGQYQIAEHTKGNPIIAYSLNLRQKFVEQFKANICDTNAAAVATTLILGYKANLSPDVMQAYSKTGTIHVLSVSGAHVAIVYVFISFLLGFMGASRYSHWLKGVITIVVIWGYAMLTGFSPPVCRAAIMLTVIIIGKAGYQNVNQLNLLAFSAMILLLYDPLFIADIGFQLSYLAVFGLIVLQPVIVKWYVFKNKWAQKFWYFISASIAAQVITFPLSAFYFHQFPLYFLMSNLLIIIPSEVALFCGILAMLFGKIAVVGKFIYTCLEYTIRVMNKGLMWIEHQPYAALDQIWFTRAECVLLFIALMAVFYFMYNRNPAVLKLGLISFLLLSVSFTVKKIDTLSNNSVIFFTINKHFAIAFKNGKESILLSDLKPTDQLYIYNIKPAIDSSGIDNDQIIDKNRNFRNDWFKKSGNLVQFHDQTLIIFDKTIENFIPKKHINASYLYVTGNPQTTLGFLNTYYRFKELIIDSTNSPATIKRFVAEASELKIKFFVLKRNKSLIVISKS